MDFEPCQVVFAHDFMWAEFTRWLSQTGLTTFPIPTSEDDLPTYGVKPIQLT